MSTVLPDKLYAYFLAALHGLHLPSDRLVHLRIVVPVGDYLDALDVPVLPGRNLLYDGDEEPVREAPPEEEIFVELASGTLFGADIAEHAVKLGVG